MNFDQLAWGAVCFYYRAAGDNKYGKIMSDTTFISKLRTAPDQISVTEFEEKVILKHVKIENYDLLIGHKLAQTILTKIIELQPEIRSLQDTSLLECNLSDNDTVEKISNIYATLYSINGLWVTGVSKIAHLLNDRLFALLNMDISSHFQLFDTETSLTKWIRIIQQNAQEVTQDFNKKGYTGSPGLYLSQKLGYADIGYEKSLIKFIDEYFWLRLGDNLPVPPKWIPAHDM
jgi:hypothetical protein